MTRIVVIGPASASAPSALELRPEWLAGELHYSDGQVKRFGPDEEYDADVPKAIQFDTQQPGGFGSGSLVLPRPPKLRADDAALFSDFILYGPGARGRYEGRVAGMPQVGSEEIRLELEGHSAALDDDETFRVLISDMDLSHWQGSGTQRQLVLTNGGWNPDGPQVLTDTATGQPALLLRANGDWATNGKPHPHAYYDAHGLAIGSLYWAWKKNDQINHTDGNWTWEPRLSSDDLSTTVEGPGNQRALGPGSGTITASGVAKRFCEVALYYGVAGGGAGLAYDIYWTCLAVCSDHGLTLQGTASATEPQGFHGHDVIAYALDRAAPQLNYTIGDSIEQSTYIIRHLVFLEDTTASELVKQVTALGGAQLYPNDWGVFDNREFFHKSPGSYGKTWRLRKDQAVTPTSDGPQAKSRVRGMKVSYQDGSRRTHSVGPPGSGAEFETEELLDSDPSNPASRLSRRFAHRSVGITNQEGATNIAKMLLAEANRINWQGTMEVRGEATDEAGNRHPTSAMRAGDQVVIEDDEGLWSPLPVNSTSFTNDDLKATVHVGAPPNRGEVLLAQLAAATDLVAA